MKKYLTNVKNGVSFFKVNEYIPFKIKWFDYIIQRNLPWYYRIVPIIVEIKNSKEIDEIIEKLGQKFALIIIEKYINAKTVVFTIVTNKTLKEISEILEETEIKALY